MIKRGKNLYFYHLSVTKIEYHYVDCNTFHINPNITYHFKKKKLIMFNKMCNLKNFSITDMEKDLDWFLKTLYYMFQTVFLEFCFIH